MKTVFLIAVLACVVWIPCSADQYPPGGLIWDLSGDGGYFETINVSKSTPSLTYYDIIEINWNISSLGDYATEFYDAMKEFYDDDIELYVRIGTCFPRRNTADLALTVMKLTSLTKNYNLGTGEWNVYMTFEHQCGGQIVDSDLTGRWNITGCEGYLGGLLVIQAPACP